MSLKFLKLVLNQRPLYNLSLKNCRGRYSFVNSEISPHNAYETRAKKIHEFYAHTCHVKL